MSQINTVLTSTGRTSELEAKLQRRLRANNETAGDVKVSKQPPQEVPTPENVWQKKEMPTPGKVKNLTPAPPWMKSLAVQAEKNTIANEVTLQSAMFDFEDMEAQEEAHDTKVQSEKSTDVGDKKEDAIDIAKEDAIDIAQEPDEQENKAQVEPMIMRLNGQRRRPQTINSCEDLGSILELETSSDDRTLSQSSSKFRAFYEFPSSESPLSPLQGVSSTLSTISTTCMDDDEMSDGESSDGEHDASKELELEYDDAFDLLNHMPREKALKVAQTITDFESEAQALNDQNRRLSSVIGRVAGELEAVRELADFETPNDADARELLDHLAAELDAVRQPTLVSDPSSQLVEESVALIAETTQRTNEVQEDMMAEGPAQSKEDEDEDKLSVADSEAEEVLPGTEDNEADSKVEVFFRGQRRHNRMSATAIECVKAGPTPAPELSATEAVQRAYHLGTARSAVQAGYASMNSTLNYASCGAAATLQVMDSTVDYAGAALENATDQLSEFATTTSTSLYQSAETLSEVATTTSSSLYQSAEKVATTTSNSLYQSAEMLSEVATTTSHSFYQFVPGLQATERLSGMFSSAWTTSES